MHEFLAVDLIQYILEHTSESGVCAHFGVQLRHIKPASSDPLRRLAYPALDSVQELERGSTVEYAVVEGDLQVHHAAHGDGVVYDDRTLDDCFCGEDRRLRVVDNGRRDHASQRARVVHGEGAARDVFGAEVSSAGAMHEVVDLAGEPDEAQLVGVGDNGHDEGVFEVDGHADVYALSQDYAVPVPDRVEDGILFKALDNRLYYERQVGKLCAFALGERGLLPLAQRGEPAHVHLDHGPGVWGLALARGHAVGYGPPDAAQVLDAVALVDWRAFGLPLGFDEGFSFFVESWRRVFFALRCRLLLLL